MQPVASQNVRPSDSEPGGSRRFVAILEPLRDQGIIWGSVEGNRERQMKRENAAGAAVVTHPDPPAMGLDDLAADGQAQTHATAVTLRAGVHLMELPEDALLEFVRHSRTRVSHLDQGNPLEWLQTRIAGGQGLSYSEIDRAVRR